MNPVAAAESVAFAREPIHDAAGALAGYELIGLRAIAADGSLGGRREATGPEAALAALADVGPAEATGGAPAFLNITASLLEQIDPLPFGPDGIVLELEPPDGPSAGLVQRAWRLRDRGYTIALDGAPCLGGLEDLAAAVHIVKLRASELDGPLARRIAELSPAARIAAVGVDDHALLAQCLGLGASLVQGAVHVRPRPLEGRPIPVGDLSRLRAAATLGGGGDDLDDLTQAISLDVGLSLRLLRFLNSAAFSLRSPVSSVRQAVVLLGPRTVRQWALMVTLAGTSAPRGPVVVRALARARLAEALARRLGATDVDAYFTAGLFSVLDALLDAPMPVLLGELPLAADLQAALLHGTGGKGRVLAVVRLAEAGDWTGAQALAPGVPVETLAALHTASLRWADASTRALAG